MTKHVIKSHLFRFVGGLQTPLGTYVIWSIHAETVIYPSQTFCYVRQRLGREDAIWCRNLIVRGCLLCIVAYVTANRYTKEGY